MAEQQLQLHGHNCLDTGCLLEAEIMIAFKANMFARRGADTGGKGTKSATIFKNINVCHDSNFSLQLISYTALSLLLSSSALVVSK